MKTERNHVHGEELNKQDVNIWKVDSIVHQLLYNIIGFRWPNRDAVFPDWLGKLCDKQGESILTSTSGMKFDVISIWFAVGYFSTEHSTHINPLRVPVSIDYVANI